MYVNKDYCYYLCIIYHINKYHKTLILIFHYKVQQQHSISLRELRVYRDSTDHFVLNSTERSQLIEYFTYAWVYYLI